MTDPPSDQFYPVEFDRFPDCSKYRIGEIEIRECEWLAFVREDGMLRVELHINGQLAGLNELQVIDVEDIPEFDPCEYKIGWSAGIDVEDAFRSVGIGTDLWRVGDLILQTVHGRDQVRIFVNASINNPWFARSILRKVDTVIFISMDGDFVYLLR